MTPKPLRVADYDPIWPTRFLTIARDLRDRLGEVATRIDHIGSTAVPGLPAKDLIDIQITVDRLDDADRWPDELLTGLLRRQRGTADDHSPPGYPTDAAEWTRHYWSDRQRVHVHVREAGRLNQRFALLFRDYLRADPVAAQAYGQLKRALVLAAPDNWDTYYAVKEPAFGLIIAGAEQWALRSRWLPMPSDA